MLATWGTSTGIGALFASSSLSLDFSNSSYTLGGVPYAVASVPGYTFTRASGGYAENTDGSLTYFASGIPRITNKGYLSEEARTNIFFPSNGSTAYNILVNVAVTATGVAGAPDGTSTATTLTRAAIIADDRALRNIIIANDNTTYTYSIFVRSGPSQQIKVAAQLAGGTINPSAVLVVDIATGAIISGTGVVTKVGLWWRISVSLTNNTSGNTIFGASLYPTTAYPSITTGSVDYWGVQVEAGAFATSYIPTTTAAATRAADVLNYSGTWYNSTAGTIVSNTESGISSGTNRLLYSVYLASAPTGGIGAAALSNVLFLDKFGTGTILVQSSSFTGAGKYAIRYNSSGISGSLSGGSIVSTSTTFPATADNLGVGKSVTSNFLNGYVKSITIYPTALTDAQLQAITT